MFRGCAITIKRFQKALLKLKSTDPLLGLLLSTGICTRCCTPLLKQDWLRLVNVVLQ